jgi:photosystem II stability/assembly factor-like uncharacterized protein
MFKRNVLGAVLMLSFICANPLLQSQTGEGFVAVTFDPNNSKIIYVATNPFTNVPVNRIFKSLDGGKTWKSAGGPQPINSNPTAIVVDKGNGSIVYVSHMLGVYKSMDGGDHWNLNAAAGIKPAANFAPTVRNILADPNNPSTLYAGVSGEIYKSTNGASSWFPINQGLPANSLKTPIVARVLACDPSNSAVVYAGLFPGGIFKSSDAGGHWGPLNNGLPQLFDALSIATDPSNRSVIYAGSTDGLYKSTDGGSHWFRISSGFAPPATSFGAFAALAVVPGSPKVIYALTTSGLYKSVDGGQTWKLSHKNHHIWFYNSQMLAVSRNAVIALLTTQDSGTPTPYLTVDGGKNWSPLDHGYP